MHTSILHSVSLRVSRAAAAVVNTGHFLTIYVITVRLLYRTGK